MNEAKDASMPDSSSPDSHKGHIWRPTPLRVPEKPAKRQRLDGGSEEQRPEDVNPCSVTNKPR